MLKNSLFSKLFDNQLTKKFWQELNSLMPLLVAGQR